MSFDLESSGFPSSKSVGSTVLLLIGPLVGCGVSNVSGLASMNKNNNYNILILVVKYNINIISNQ